MNDPSNSSVITMSRSTHLLDADPIQPGTSTRVGPLDTGSLGLVEAPSVAGALDGDILGDHRELLEIVHPQDERFVDLSLDAKRPLGRVDRCGVVVVTDEEEFRRRVVRGQFLERGLQVDRARATDDLSFSFPGIDGGGVSGATGCCCATARSVGNPAPSTTAAVPVVIKKPRRVSTFGWSLSNLVALLQFQLFTHRDLWAWLNEPFTGPPAIEASERLVLTAVA
jgi:hypothetical protein